MNGNRIAWPNTNQTIATRPAQMPAMSQRILLRILQGLITHGAALAVAIGFFLNLRRKGTLTLSKSQFGCFLTSLNSLLELTCLSISRGKSSNVERIILLRDSIRSE